MTGGDATLYDFSASGQLEKQRGAYASLTITLAVVAAIALCTMGISYACGSSADDAVGHAFIATFPILGGLALMTMSFALVAAVMTVTSAIIVAMLPVARDPVFIGIIFGAFPLLLALGFGTAHAEREHYPHRWAVAGVLWTFVTVAATTAALGTGMALIAVGGGIATIASIALLPRAMTPHPASAVGDPDEATTADDPSLPTAP